MTRLPEPTPDEIADSLLAAFEDTKSAHDWCPPGYATTHEIARRWSRSPRQTGHMLKALMDSGSADRVPARVGGRPCFAYRVKKGAA